MQKAVVTVQAQEGLANRTATRFIQVANGYKSRLSVCQPGRTINAKSLLGVLSMKLGKGAEVEVTADGPDEEEALEALVAFLKAE